ncbi:hypothetical protein LINGRAHAP2_LOCUS16735 [Linum grandiflorum]
MQLQKTKINAVSVDRTRDLQIFSLTLSQLSYPRFRVQNVIVTILLTEVCRSAVTKQLSNEHYVSDRHYCR